MEINYTGHSLVTTLNHMIMITIDGSKGYKTASEQVRTPEIKLFLASLSAERANMAEELEREVISLGEVPDKQGGPLAALHRMWIEIKAGLESSNERSIVESCEKGDQTAISSFVNALAHEAVSPKTRIILQELLEKIEDDLLKLNTLKTTLLSNT